MQYNSCSEQFSITSTIFDGAIIYKYIKSY